jgi:hypothetical protein
LLTFNVPIKRIIYPFESGAKEALAVSSRLLVHNPELVETPKFLTLDTSGVLTFAVFHV